MVRATISSPNRAAWDSHASTESAQTIGLETVFPAGVFRGQASRKNLRRNDLARLCPQPTQGARPPFNLIGTRRMGEVDPDPDWPENRRCFQAEFQRLCRRSAARRWAISG